MVDKPDAEKPGGSLGRFLALWRAFSARLALSGYHATVARP